MKKDEKENYVEEGDNREKKTLGDLIDDIYDKINFLIMLMRLLVFNMRLTI